MLDAARIEAAGAGATGPSPVGFCVIGRRVQNVHVRNTQREEPVMTIGAALVVILAGVLIAAFLNGTVGLIVAAIGVVGLILAAVSTSRGRTAL
jgi:hypothetical protein